MIQFINAMGVTQKTKNTYLDDAVECLIFAVDTVVEARTVFHGDIESSLGFITSASDDRLQPFWTRVVAVQGQSREVLFLRHELAEVMQAIAYANQHPDRTTIYVDDLSETICG